MEELDSFYINGKVYVNTKFLCSLYNRTSKQIGRWKKDGMPSVEKKPKELNKTGVWFVLDAVMAWVEANINKTKANNSKGTQGGGDSDASKIIYDENLTIAEKRKALQALPKNTLDELNTAEQILEREAKNKAHDKNWVRKEKPSETIKALARSFISLLKNMMISISKDGEMKNQNQLYEIMDKLADTEIKKLQRFLKQDSPDIDLHQIYSIMIELHEQGISISNIAKKLKELEIE